MLTFHILLVFAIAIGCVHSQSCADKAPSEKCEEWKEKGACDKPIGEKACAKTCDKCDGGNDGTTSAPAPAPEPAPSDCEDKAPSEKCEDWKGKGACEKPFGEKACAKTCNKCNGGNDGTTSAPAPAPTPAPSDPDEKPTEPTACTDANQGRCECADTSDGFQTYTFWLGDVQRCFTVFHPGGGSIPVYLAPNCYAKDKLSGIEGMKSYSDGNAAATRYGFARFGLSSPDGAWTFGNDGVVNDDYPMPCSDEDSKDMPYLRAIFDFIESNPDQFDASKIYAGGFSQNSMFSAYIAFCFNEKVLGVWQGGSGLAYTGEKPYLPGCQAQVTASDFAECNGCNQCVSTNFCTSCQYWPIYPCYSEKRPMVDCVAVYDNDKIAVSDPDTLNTAINMYETLMNEGHDARLLRFSPSDDGTINGGHLDPKNKEFWQVGCLGITDPCSEACETAFVDCVNSQAINSASDRVEAFQTCIDEAKFTGLGCTSNCAPTYNMLAQSEEPTTVMFDNFGAGAEVAGAQPSTSKCTATSN